MTNLWKTTEGKWKSQGFPQEMWKKKWWKTTMWKTEIVEKWKTLCGRAACCGNTVDKKT